MRKVLTGLDVLLSEPKKFSNLSIAFVTNDVAAAADGMPARTALLKAGFTITKLFSPEHGITATGEDGTHQNSSIDPLTQLPVTSLYGDHLMPAENDFAGIDIVLFDIPDVGCRFYTYLWTMTCVMEACAKYKKPLVILDRPNPISGNIEKAEGPMLDEKNCSSFTGRWNIPVRHSCTIGELAVYFAATKIKDVQVEIIPVQNWNRNQTAEEAGWQFVPTSPAIRDIETAMLYPGMGLLEGINVNEGRGTDTPFKIMGAPWINAEQLNNAFIGLQLPGISTAAVSYTPSCGLYANEVCEGLNFSISDSQAFEPVKTGLELLRLIALLYPEQINERLYPTVANPSGKKHLDKLTGVCQSFEKIKNGEELSASLHPEDWAKIIQPHLLY